jgi:pyridoxamine 5'-phosphate oxidase
MSLRSLLRSQPSIVGTAPPLGEVPEHPRSLIVNFLTTAIEAEIPEPHAITLITVDSTGFPDARVLIIKDIDDDGNVAIATSAHSAKGRQLLENNKVALSWYCTPQARAIRIRGTAELADEEVIRADFAARSGRAKATAKAGKQSEVIDSGTNRKALIDAKEKELQALEGGEEEEMPDWQVWWIAPEEIEFWQGAKDRNHERLQYKRKKDGSGWEHATLWP